MATKSKKTPTGAAAVRSATKIITDAPVKTKKWTDAEIWKMAEKKAYFYFLERGSVHGRDREDWARAEKEVRKWTEKNG